MASLHIISFWKTASLPLTNADQRRNLLLGTLSLWKQGIIILTTKFWWLLLLIFCLQQLSILFFSESYDFVINTLSTSSFLYLGLMSLRPSIETKNYNYFLRYSNAWLILIGISFFIPILIWQALFVPMILFLLFFLDSKLRLQDTITSFVKALKTTIYCLPMVAIITVLFNLTGIFYTNLLVKQLLSSSHTHACLCLLITPLSLLSNLFFLATITTYYLKLKHEHYNVFFT